MEDWETALLVILFVIVVSTILVKMLFFKVSAVSPEPRSNIYELKEDSLTEELPDPLKEEAE